MEPPRFRMMCADHGEARPCRVCPHLSGKRVSGRGFNPAQSPDPDPKWGPVHEAWCDKCEFWFRLPKPAREALGARFDYEETRIQNVPNKFACPSVVQRDGATNSGATEPFQPWSEAVAQA